MNAKFSTFSTIEVVPVWGKLTVSILPHLSFPCTFGFGCLPFSFFSLYRLLRYRFLSSSLPLRARPLRRRSESSLPSSNLSSIEFVSRMTLNGLSFVAFP